MRILQSLSFRLALIYVALFGLSVAALLAFYFWISVRAPLEAVQTRVQGEADAYARVYILDGADALVRGLEARAVRLDDRMPFHAFLDPEGRVLSSNLPSWPAYAGRRWLWIEADIYADGDETDHEAIVLDRRFDDGARLLIGRDVEDIDDLREQLVAAAWWMLAGTMLLGVVGGALMSRAIGRRIETINRAARTVIAGDLSGRVVTRGSGDDFDRLGETLNLMLARIEELVESVRRVSDSVAHELRTPLMRMLVGLEELAEEKDEDRRRQLAEEAIEEARRLHRLFDALLRIARIESGRHRARTEPVALDRLVADAVEFHQPEADARGRRLHLGTVDAGTVSGDPDLLFQAVSNLIDNAVKYTPSGGEIIVSVEGEGQQIRLSVCDDGIGIPAAERSRVTQRFFRGEGTSGIPGAGLGLSLTSAVAALHQARLEFPDRDRGTRADMIFPRQTGLAS